jgi:hypothetical protein
MTVSVTTNKLHLYTYYIDNQNNFTLCICLVRVSYDSVSAFLSSNYLQVNVWTRYRAAYGSVLHRVFDIMQRVLWSLARSNLRRFHAKAFWRLTRHKLLVEGASLYAGLVRNDNDNGDYIFFDDNDSLGRECEVSKSCRRLTFCHWLLLYKLLRH